MENNQANVNEQAWSEDTYEAWVQRFGKPSDMAVKLMKAPAVKLQPLYEVFGEVKDKKIVNLMGSNGIKAVALALLGAEVTVIDFSPANERYALELAEAAGVNINYIVSDVLKLSGQEFSGSHDIAFAELGILHYFTDLHPFFRVAAEMLKPNGTFIIRDFHPVSTKLISSSGSTANVRKHKVTGDYFDTSLHEVEVSYSKYSSNTAAPKERSALIRRWNLGEIITAMADERFHIKLLREEPNLSSEVYDKGIPKTFTIAAEKRQFL